MKNQVLLLIAAAVGLLAAAPRLAVAQTTPTTAAGITAITVTCPVHQFLAGKPGTVVLTVSVAYQGTLSRLGVRLAAPAGSTAKWTFVSATGPTAQPLPGDKTQWEFSYATTPASPVTFNVVLNYADLADPDDSIFALQTFTATALLGTVVATDSRGSSIQTTLSLSEARFHTADENKDTRLSLDELLTVVQIYNTRNANTRTGAYDTNFAPLPNAAPIAPAKPHSADLNRDGTISLMELNRVLDLCTYSKNGIRTGEYRADTLGVDGFTPGP